MHRYAALAAVVLLLPAVSLAQNCVTISQSLQLGSTGAEVTALQEYFDSLYKEYTAEYVTSYFGLMTQAALQQWQKDRGIVTGGSPKTTGWGIAGPKTRAALACAPSASVGTPAATGDSMVDTLFAQLKSLQARLSQLLSGGTTMTASVASTSIDSDEEYVTASSDVAQSDDIDAQLRSLDALLSKMQAADLAAPQDI